MAMKWSDLSPATRKVLVTVGSLDAALRAAALVDLKRRSKEEVRGSKRAWALGLALVNSSGVLPIAYFVRGRRPVG